jgi:hypothetical protein
VLGIINATIEYAHTHHQGSQILAQELKENWSKSLVCTNLKIRNDPIAKATFDNKYASAFLQLFVLEHIKNNSPFYWILCKAT